MSETDCYYDVIVVGAGLVGSAFALLLSQKFSGQSNFKIAVVERRSALTPAEESNQRVVALGDVATNLLKEVGVFEALDEKSCNAYQNMFVWDQNTDGELAFSAEDYDRLALGHMIDSHECTRLLQYQLEQSKGIQTYYQFAATSLDFRDSRLNLSRTADAKLFNLELANVDSHNAELHSHDRVLKTSLVVAADGSQSWVRQKAKILSTQYDYQQRGIVAKISSKFSHDNCAWQRFLETGPVAVLPLSENHSSIVWSANLSLADELTSMPENEFETALSEALEGRLGAIKLLSNRQSFPLKSQSAERYFKKGVVLIGDAAHSIHPLAGQGANLGFKDAVSLVDVLYGGQQSIALVETENSTHSDSFDLGNLALLERYQRTRRLDNQHTDMMMSALHLAYQSNAPWWLGLRSLGMNWIQSSAFIKQALAKQAMGI